MSPRYKHPALLPMNAHTQEILKASEAWANHQPYRDNPEKIGRWAYVAKLLAEAGFDKTTCNHVLGDLEIHRRRWAA
jgi:hypothetical protein